MYTIFFTKKAHKDKQLLKNSGLEKKTKDLLTIIATTPYQTPPHYEKLVGNMDGLYSRRINLKHRLVYEVIENEKTIKVLSMWTHYEF